MNQLILTLNHWTATVGALAGEQFLQSSVFIILVLLVDLFLHRKISAGFRHALWLLILVKLLMPPSVSFPTGASNWLQITSANSTSIVSDSNYRNETAGKMTVSPKPDRLDYDMTLISSPQAKLSMSAYFLIFYTVVSIGFFVILWDRRRGILKDLKCSRRPPIWAADALEAVRIQMKCRRKIELQLTDAMGSPFVCGLRNPVIFLPANLLEKLTHIQLKTVFAHEVTHVKRFDIWTNSLQSVLQIIYWWHPLVWLANVRIGHLREQVTDDAVIFFMKGDSQTYAQTLLTIAKSAVHRPGLSLGILKTKSFLRHRVERFLKNSTTGQPGITKSGIIIVLVFGAVFLPMGRTQSINHETANHTKPQAGKHSLDEIQQLLKDRDEAAVKAKTAEKLAWESGVGRISLGFESAGIVREQEAASGSKLTAYDRYVKTAKQIEHEIQEDVKQGRRAVLFKDIAIYERLQAEVDLARLAGKLPTEEKASSAAQPLHVEKQQLIIEAKFIVIRGFKPSSVASDNPLSFLPETDNTNAPTIVPVSATKLYSQLKYKDSLKLEFSSNPTVIRLLTAAQADQTLSFLKNLRTQGKATFDWLSPAPQTIQSGRQLQFANVNKISIVSGSPTFKTKEMDGSPSDTGLNYPLEQIEVGPALDVIPYPHESDQSITLHFLGASIEFLGYTKPSKSNVISIPPQPRVRIQEVTGQSRIKLGQTLLIGGPVSYNIVTIKDKVPFLDPIRKAADFQEITHEKVA